MVLAALVDRPAVQRARADPRDAAVDRGRLRDDRAGLQGRPQRDRDGVFAALFALTMRRGATDPVCGMTVDRSTRSALEHAGRDVLLLLRALPRAVRGRAEADAAPRPRPAARPAPPVEQTPAGGPVAQPRAGAADPRLRGCRRVIAPCPARARSRSRSLDGTRARRACAAAQEPGEQAAPGPGRHAALRPRHALPQVDDEGRAGARQLASAQCARHLLGRRALRAAQRLDASRCTPRAAPSTGTSTSTTPSDRREAERLLAMLFGPDSQGNENALARRMGIIEAIWDCRYYGFWMAGGQSKRYSACTDSRGQAARRRRSDDRAPQPHPLLAQPRGRADADELLALRLAAQAAAEARRADPRRVPDPEPGSATARPSDARPAATESQPPVRGPAAGARHRRAPPRTTPPTDRTGKSSSPTTPTTSTSRAAAPRLRRCAPMARDDPDPRRDDPARPAAQARRPRGRRR